MAEFQLEEPEESLSLKIAEGDIVTIDGFVDDDGRLIRYRAAYKTPGRLTLIPTGVEG